MIKYSPILILACFCITGCKKNVKYKADIILLDHYTNERISNHPTYMSKCESGIMGFGNCDPYASKLSDQNGVAKFNEEISFGTMTSYGFYTKVANGYMGSQQIKIKNGAKDTLHLKQMSDVQIDVSLSTPLDSIRMTMYCFDWISQTKAFSAIDNSFSTTLLATPEESNYFRLRAYLNGVEVDEQLVEIIPKYGIMDTLAVSVL